MFYLVNNSVATKIIMMDRTKVEELLNKHFDNKFIIRKQTIEIRRQP